MSWEIAEGEAERIAALPASVRQRLFLQLVADWGEAWGLRDGEGWILQRRSDGDVFPLWPHSEVAALCAQGRWEGCLPEPITLDEVLAELLPLLEEDGLRVAVFPSAEDEGALLQPAELARSLEAELALGTDP